MDEARKLLDSLMGSHRNVDRKEAKARKGHNFKEDHVCKFYLVGFCPKHEELFHSTKRDLGKCGKVHSDLMKQEFEAHPDREHFRADYEKKLKYFLEDLVRGADDWVAREKRNIQDANRQLQEIGPSEIARTEIKALQEQSAELLAEAEKLAESGDVAGSREKLELAEEIKKRAADWEEKARAERPEDVCEVCGSRMESGNVNYARYRHQEGKIHLGYVKIRQWLQDIRKKVREREEWEEKRDDRRPRSRDRSRSRDRARARASRSGGQGERSQRRDRDRGRDFEEHVDNAADGGRDRRQAGYGADGGRERRQAEYAYDSARERRPADYAPYGGRERRKGDYAPDGARERRQADYSTDDGRERRHADCAADDGRERRQADYAADDGRERRQADYAADGGRERQYHLDRKSWPDEDNRLAGRQDEDFRFGRRSRSRRRGSQRYDEGYAEDRYESGRYESGGYDRGRGRDRRGYD